MWQFVTYGTVLLFPNTFSATVQLKIICTPCLDYDALDTFRVSRNIKIF